MRAGAVSYDLLSIVQRISAVMACSSFSITSSRSSGVILTLSLAAFVTVVGLLYIACKEDPSFALIRFLLCQVFALKVWYASASCDAVHALIMVSEKGPFKEHFFFFRICPISQS